MAEMSLFHRRLVRTAFGRQMAALHLGGPGIDLVLTRKRWLHHRRAGQLGQARALATDYLGARIANTLYSKLAA